MPEQIAVITDHDSLQFALREWADKLGLSRATIDERGNLQAGYSGKVLALTPTKRIGPDTIGPLLRALGAALILVPVDDEIKRISETEVKRRENLIRARPVSKAEKDIVIREFISHLGKKGSRVRNQKLSPEAKSRIGQIAAAKRWGHKPPASKV